jgi:uncharacterized protein
VCALLVLPALAQTLGFPQLTGRVVDAANLLNPEQRAALEAKLKAHEDKTTDQVRCSSSRRTSARSASRSGTGSKAR